MNSRVKGTPNRATTVGGRARFLEKKIEANKPAAKTTSKKFAATSTSKNDSSLQSENGGGNQAPQTWEERAEMDIQYSKYLQAKLLENIMAKNATLIGSHLEEQHVALANKEKQEMEKLQILQQCMTTVKQLVKEEAELDQLVPKLQSLVDNLQELAPHVDKLSQAMATSADHLTANNIQLPVNQEETENLSSSLKQLALQNKETINLGEYDVSIQLSDLTQQYKIQTNQNNRSNQNLQEKLVPATSLQLAVIMNEK